MSAGVNHERIRQIEDMINQERIHDIEERINYLKKRGHGEDSTSITILKRLIKFRG